MAHFDRLRNTLEWREIHNCPGRYVLPGGSNELDRSVRNRGRRFEVPAAPDPVWLLLMDKRDGALLSYEKADGSFLHTLNTTEGLQRKCAQLGLDLAQFLDELDAGVHADDAWDLQVEDFGPDRSWAVRLIRQWTELSLAEAALATERPVRLKVGGWRPDVQELLETVREHGGDGVLVVAKG